MRLIDADVFFENFPELAIEPYINAPTVEYPFYAEAYQTGYEEAKKEFERQSGELIRIPRNQPCSYKYKCSVCSYDGIIQKKNFCPNCGAKMIKGEEE